jgi:hypothetical protein
LYFCSGFCLLYRYLTPPPFRKTGRAFLFTQRKELKMKCPHCGSSSTQKRNLGRKMGGSIGAIAGGMAGITGGAESAALGAAAGSLIPGVGTLAGGVIGF